MGVKSRIRILRCIHHVTHLNTVRSKINQEFTPAELGSASVFLQINEFTGAHLCINVQHFELVEDPILLGFTLQHFELGTSLICICICTIEVEIIT